MAASFTAFSTKMRGPLSCLRPSVTTSYRCCSTRRIGHASPPGIKVGVPDFAFAFECASHNPITLNVLLTSLQHWWRPSQELQGADTSTGDASIPPKATYSLHPPDQRRGYTWDGASSRTHECARSRSWYKYLRSKSYPIRRPCPWGYAICSTKGSMHPSHGGESGQLSQSSWRVRSGIFACISALVLIVYASSYGFTNVISPADIIAAYPDLMPFARSSSYASFSRPLPRPPHKPESPVKNPLKIDAIFIFNDPRDWALDMQLILDLLLSHAGILGTLSPLNGNTSLPNCGYQQDGQPALYFSNPDLFWAAKYHLPRLGQGGFREALEGVWRAVTGGEEKGVTLQKRMYGKPYRETYAFAERRLLNHRNDLAGRCGIKDDLTLLKTVYMVGGMWPAPPCI